jgi:Xaa-Pro aminopeptidase
MTKPEERRCNPASVSELERRWNAVRGLMPVAGLDALIVQGMNNFNGTGGYFRWLTGASVASSYPSTVIFPKDAPMTVVTHGAFGEDVKLDPASPATPGVGHRFGAPAFPAINYTVAYEAELVAREIKKAGFRKIGLVASNNMLAGFWANLSRELGGIEISDATDLIDSIKAIKSPEEIAYIRKTGEMQDEIMRKVRAFLRPGLRDFEVMAYAQYQGQLMGSETGYFLGSSASPGEPSSLLRRSEQNRMIREGDVFMFQAENTGPGGLFVHHGRMFSLGRPPQEIVDLFGQLVEAQDYTIKLLQPGVSSADIFAEYNAYMRGRGLPEEKRLHCHGQGYDVVERPLIRSDETMKLAGNMNIGIHPSPGLANPKVFVTVCDNFLLHETGEVERLHHTPKEIIEI